MSDENKKRHIWMQKCQVNSYLQICVEWQQKEDKLSSVLANAKTSLVPEGREGRTFDGKIMDGLGRAVRGVFEELEVW